MFTITSLFMLGLIGTPLEAQDDAPPNVPSRPPTGGGVLRVLELEGTPYQRGVTHGKALRESIQRHVRIWQEDLERRHTIKASEFIRRFRARTRYEDAIQRWTPDLLEEIKGIADGSGLDRDTIFVFQFMDEQWARGSDVTAEHCSCLGLVPRGKEPGFIAQNMDLESFRDGFQVVLRIKYPDSDLECFVLTCAGVIGLNGLNNRAIGVCVNTLPQLESSGEGLPVNCVVRGVLQRKSLDDAVSFLREVKHASGQNYLVGSPSRIEDVECSARKTTRYNPPSVDGVFVHTNHPFTNDDYNIRYRGLTVAERTASLANSEARHRTLDRRIRADKDSPRLALIRSSLSSRDSKDHPICVVGGQDWATRTLGVTTFACTIMELTGEPRLLVAPGPPNRTDFQVFSFAKKQ